MKSRLRYSLITLVIAAALLVTTATARRGSRKSKKRDDPEPPSWKPNSHPAKGTAIFPKQAGQKITLKCPADGNPKPKVKWLKNGDPIQKSATGRIKDRKFNLIMSDLQVSDSGNYTCSVHNKAGVIDWTYTVRVLKVIWPLEVDGPENKTVYEGENVTFHCRVLNDPEAQTQWLRRTLGQGIANKTKLESEKQMFIPTDEDPSRLVLSRVTLADAGLYKCLVGNFNGLKYSDAWLTVLPAQKVDIPPTTVVKEKKKDMPKPTKPTPVKTTEMMKKEPKTNTVPPTTEKVRKRPNKNKKLTTVTEDPREWRPKLTAKPDRGNSRGGGRGSKKKPLPLSPDYTHLATMPPKTKPPRRKDVIKKKKDKSVYLEPKLKAKTNKPETTVLPAVKTYDMPPLVEKPSQEEGADKALAGDSDRSRPVTIDLRTVYIIVGAVAGGILLIGLVTLIVAVACAKRVDEPYKSTTV